MRCKPTPDVGEFAEFADELDEHRAQTEPVVKQAFERATTSHIEACNADELSVATRAIDGAFRDIDRAVEELRVQNDALFAAQVGLEESNAVFRDLFERAPFPYLVTTTSSLITFANDAACRFFNRAKNALVRTPVTSFVPLVERDVFREALARSCESPGVTSWPMALLPTRARAAVRCRVQVGVVEGRSPSGSSQLYWNIAEETDEDLF